MQRPFNINSLVHTHADRYGTRNANRIRVKVKVLSINGQVVAGQLWPYGESQQVIYEDLLNSDEVRSLVASEDEAQLLEFATKAHETQKAAWLRENKGKDDSRYPGSIAGEFYRLAGRGMSPIAYIEPVESVGAPDTPEAQATRQMDRLADSISAGITKALRGGELPVQAPPAPKAKEKQG